MNLFLWSQGKLFWKKNIFEIKIQICGRGGDSWGTISDVAKTEATRPRGKMTSWQFQAKKV